MIHENVPVTTVEIGPTHRMVISEAVDALVGSIGQIGLTVPIAVRRSGDTVMLIAGRQRLEAHKRLGLDTIPAIVFDDDAVDAKIREYDENLCRTNLTPVEEALAHHERKQLWESKHPETKHGGDRRSENRSSGQSGQLKPYAEDAAKKTGKAERTVRRHARRGAELGGTVLEKIKNTSLDEKAQLDALVELKSMSADDGPALVKELAAAAASGKKVDAKTELKKLNRSRRERDLAEKIETAAEVLGEKLYGVIVADPPWSRDTWSEAGKSRDPANHYPTQDENYLADLKIPAASDCVLFLWSTQEHLDQAMRLIETWGFKYKSGAVWVKPKISTGYWFRTKHELILVATRGQPVAPAPGTQIDSAFEAPVGRHSEKPTVIHDMVDRLWPETPKLEMFARSQRDGWHSWGAEAPDEAA